jgi:glutathione synthase/RimK-type ligase-like ATP-grasp enzyme
MPDLALLTCRELLRARPDSWYVAQVHREDGLVRAALEARGLRVERVDWADAGYDWGAARCALFRTTWDYFHRIEEFTGWLGRARAATRLVNAAEVVSWNLDKRYLFDLQRAGVPVVAGKLLERGVAVDLPELLAAEGWKQAVIKPVISGGARLTFRIDAQDAGQPPPALAQCLGQETMLAQPFVEGIVEQGEVSVVMIDGAPTHAVRKVPKPGDFRVQDDHGGTVHAHDARPDELALARLAVERCGREVSYARVDMARDARGHLMVMELELIEPELFFRFCPSAAERLAEAIVRQL